jgi:DMSO/TMAO reductase YedYZ heme-binding membrane subunit
MTTVLPDPALLRRSVGLAPGPFVVWGVRSLIPIPFVLMAPEVIAAIRHEPEAMADLSASVADVMGNSIFIAFVLMLAVTPITTITGWRRHVVLRRDLGLAMFALAWTDLVLAAIATGDQFEGGVVNRVAGHSFLLLGTLATVLTLPLALTANRRAQRALGTYWKSIQRVTYLVWALILVHLLLLFGVRDVFLHAMEVSVVLVIPRIPVITSWWVRSRRSGAWPRVRLLMALVLAGVLVAGLLPFVQDLAAAGTNAFHQHPVDD